MLCTRDRVEMVKRQIHGVNVDYCDICGGMYLHHGELNKVADETAGDLEFSTLDQESFQHPDESGPVRCPNDPETAMDKVEFLIGTNLILDYCQVCRGFWIDGRELARINEEVGHLNEAAREVPDPPLVRFANFIWNLPFPK